MIYKTERQIISLQFLCHPIKLTIIGILYKFNTNIFRLQRNSFAGIYRLQNYDILELSLINGNINNIE